MNINELFGKLNELNKKYKERQKQLYDKGEAYPEMDEEFQNISYEISSVKEEINDSKEELYAYGYYRKMEFAESRLEELNRKLDAKMTDLYNKEEAYPKMDEEVIKLQNEISKIKSNVLDLEENISNTKPSKLVSLKNNLKSLNSKFEARMSALYDALDAYPEMDKEVMNLQKEISKTNDDIKKLEKKILESAAFIKLKQFEIEQKYIKKEQDEYLKELDKKGVSHTDKYMNQGLIKFDNDLKNVDKKTKELKKLIASGNLTPEILDDFKLPKRKNKVKKQSVSNSPSSTSDKKEEVKDDTKRKMKVKKAAYFALGTALGVGLSFAIQPGTGGLIISVGRLTYAASKKALQVYVDKHKDEPNNKVIKVVEDLNHKKATFAESHPKIAKGVSKINEFLKKPETQVFINGVSTGYTIGKLGQAVSKLIPKAPKVENTTVINKEIAKVAKPKPTVTTQVDTFDPSKPIDLSSIKDGYVSSYADNSVPLLTDAGKDLVFDKINVVDGKTMIHFKQANGLGYAWLPADEVMDALNITDISKLTGGISK